MCKQNQTCVLRVLTLPCYTESDLCTVVMSDKVKMDSEAYSAACQPFRAYDITITSSLHHNIVLFMLHC